MKPKPTIFLTGGTGLVGSYLLKILLENNHKVYCLARSKNNQSAKSRIINTLKFWDKQVLKKASNLKIIEGDITDKNMGLNQKTTDLLIKEVEETYHSAAITDLNIPLDQIRQSNVEGTRKILELGLKLRKTGRFKKINHISTAYIYGSYQGRFNEDDLDVGQKFNTNYEKTKFEAEKLIWKYRKRGLWVDIFRPSMILGESYTGKTFQFKHMYQLLNLCRLELFDSLPFLNGYVSLVPIDITTQAIYTIAEKTKEKNMAYHPFPKKLTSIRDILKLGGKILSFNPPQVVSLKVFSLLNLTPVQKMLLSDSVLSVNFKTKINSDKTNVILEKYHSKIPDINDRILAKILKYYLNFKK